jgi:chemotaxis protein histidine kinase CheA
MTAFTHAELAEMVAAAGRENTALRAQLASADRIRGAIEEQLAAARAANADLQRDRQALALRVSDLELQLAAAREHGRSGGIIDAARTVAVTAALAKAAGFTEWAESVAVLAANIRELAEPETKKGPSAPAAAPAEPPHDAVPGARFQSTQPSDTKEQRHG